MKKFFNDEDKEKEKDKIIELTFGMDYEDIKDNFEDVDGNGEEKNEEKKTEETTKAAEPEAAGSRGKRKKKKRNKYFEYSLCENIIKKT